MWLGDEFASLWMTLTNQHSWKGIWWDCVWMATGRSGFVTVVVKRWPFIWSEREQQVSLMQKTFHSVNAFYIGETRSFLSDRTNGHRFPITVLNPDLPVAIHTQSHQISFQECLSVSVIHKLPNSTADHICCQFESTYQLFFQSHHILGLNIR